MDSRIGAALIMLGGGRRTEAMRTHGLSKTFVYDNFHKVVDAINSCPQLEIKSDNSMEGLRQAANKFKERSFVLAALMV